MSNSAPQNDTPHHDRPGGVNGAWFIAITLSLFIIVPAIVIGVLKLVPEAEPPAPLSYADRADWPAMELRPRELEYNMFVAAETGKKYRKADFELAANDEAMLHQATWFAQQPDFFTNENYYNNLLEWADRYDTQFYPPYLVAEWLRVNGRTNEADAWRQTAFERATGAILQHLQYEDGTPAAGHALPAVAIAYDRVIDGELVTTLHLVYPAPTAEEAGNVYLPTFESVYRLTDPALPPGADTANYPRDLTLLPQTQTRQTPNWFSSPERVGRLPDAVVGRE